MPAKLKNIITFDQLCKHIGVETLDDYTEALLHNSDTIYHVAYTEAMKVDGTSEEEAENMALKAETEEHGEYVDKYIAAVEKVAKKLFEEHRLSLTETKKDSGIYRITPDVSWRDSLSELIQTINGVGFFHFSSVRELCQSGPYTFRHGVLAHIGYVFDFSLVYE